MSNISHKAPNEHEKIPKHQELFIEAHALP